MKLRFKLGNYYTDDLGFHLNPSYQISSPQAKTYVVDVPFGDGVIDLTESLTGNVAYTTRKISFVLEKLRPKNIWDASYNNLLKLLQGKKVKVIPPYEVDHYYLGRIEIGTPSRGTKLTIPIDITCDPFRYKNDITEVNIVSNATEQLVVLNNESMPTIITLETNDEIQVFFDSKSYVYSAGTYKLPFVLKEGENSISFIGNANIKLKYQEGVL